MKHFGEMWNEADLYHRFELGLTAIVIVVVSVIACFAAGRLAYTVADLLFFKQSILAPQSFPTLFGMIFVVLIALEFNRAIICALPSTTEVIYGKGVIMIAILVVIRKLIVTDLATLSLDATLGLAALMLALGALFYLIGDNQKPPDGHKDTDA